ncbi:hypothetical protein P7H00_05990 [Enterococcus pseudoavium]|uniref:Uncharacterized protein n=1 Tax=Enterococcus pseudoavium TaxID=44007 RepID=A0AAE4I0G6_9ENTE|nr:hypothetical protein [Enterococcus pseudoavium]MDT2736688.1 hypothetical protein [Enterococcus pseudoavium]MDT2753691.1 hypothetical protein [Enterococcus pseudoavium]MDT2771274.1 hypothetical protein [Enterococcus pseudoavium]
MNTAKELYQFTKKYGINYNTNEEKGILLFNNFLQAFPKTNFSFSFIGFHKYESVKKQEGLTGYGISGNILYALSKQKAYKYNLYQCKEISGKKKLNGIRLMLHFDSEILKINLGFADGNLVSAALKQASNK